MKRQKPFNNVELTIFHKGGEEKHVEVSGFPVFDKNNNLLFYRGITRDITLTKEIHDKMNLTLSQMNAILNNMPFLAWLKDTFGRYISVNKAFSEFFEEEKEFFINKKDIDIYDFSIAEKYISADLEVLGSKKQVYFEYEIEKNNEILWFEAYINPILDDNNNIIGLNGLARDISERKKFENEIIKARDLADSANKAKSEFLANMSHEIRTPMNAILGFSEILLNTIETPKEKNYLKTILNSGRILLALINDILDLSKIEAGKFDIVLEEVDIQTILNELKYIFIQKAEEKGITIIVEQSTSFPNSILIDEIRIRQVLLNLVGNALKFTEKGFVKVEAHAIQNDINEKYIDLIIDVIDTGVGIHEDQQEIIFEAFRQQEGQSSRKYGGTGLGLAISKRLVEIMNGSISVTSKQNEGSTFRIYLKNVQISNNILHEHNNSIEKVNNYRFYDSKILIVDDVAHNRELVQSYLQDSDVKIYEAENGLQAIEIAKNILPDLILMDIRMPIMNGYESTFQIKQIETLKHIPVIAFTASYLKSDEEKINKNFDGFISKPISKSVLFDTFALFLKFEQLETEIDPNELDNEINFNNGNLTLEEYHSIIESLENEFISKRNEILEVLWIDEAEKFADLLNEIGEKYNIDLLIKYSTNLKTNIISFEIEKVEIQLKDFDRLINDFKVYYQPK